MRFTFAVFFYFIFASFLFHFIFRSSITFTLLHPQFLPFTAQLAITLFFLLLNSPPLHLRLLHLLFDRLRSDFQLPANTHTLNRFLLFFFFFFPLFLLTPISLFLDVFLKSSTPPSTIHGIPHRAGRNSSFRWLV